MAFRTGGFDLIDGLIVDNFAGGGGASTGIEQALGRCVDVAINHDAEAIAMHEVNHPGTLHIKNNIWQIDPRDVTKGRRVALAWFSPDCTHHSKARGGKPRQKSIRDLSWVVVLWAQKVRPDVIFMENVEEIQSWGPLDGEGQPIKARAGEEWQRWLKALRAEGYRIQFKELRACDYGAPTIRKRLFLIARCDGKPIRWPKPTHGKPGSRGVLSGKLKPYRTAADSVIDFSIPCPSIFTRKKALADNTLRRIAHGIMKFVVNSPDPFIIPLTHGGGPNRAYPASDPVHTVTGANRGELAVIAPHVTKFRTNAIGHDAREPLATVTANSYVKRPGGAPPLGEVEARLAPVIDRQFGRSRGARADMPIGTVTAGGGGKSSLLGATLVHTAHGEIDKRGRKRGKGALDVKEPMPAVLASRSEALAGVTLINTRNGEREGQEPRTRDPREPSWTVTAEGSQGAVAEATLERLAVHIEQANGGPNNDNLAGRRADEPLSTVQTTGSQQRVVASNVVKLRGTCAHGQPVDEPIATVSAQGTHLGAVETELEPLPLSEEHLRGAHQVYAFLLKYYGNEVDGHAMTAPLGTVTTKDRFCIVTVEIEGETYAIVDIRMRMLTPRELFNAQGFPPDYVIDFEFNGKPLTKSAQIEKCGNSVCPPMSRALVTANFPDVALAEADQRKAA